MRAFFLATLAFLAALVVIWFVVLLVYLLGESVGWWRDRDGGVAMGFMFFFGPVFGLIGGLAVAVKVFLSVRRKDRLAREAAPKA